LNGLLSQGEGKYESLRIKELLTSNYGNGEGFELDFKTTISFH